MTRKISLAALAVLSMVMVACQFEVRTGEEAEEHMEEMQDRMEDDQQN